MSYRAILNETSYHGKGAIENLVFEIKKRRFKKALICTDENLINANVVSKVSDLLDISKIKYEVFTNIRPNPTIENVIEGVKTLKKANADFIIALGGGSVIDAAKAIGIIITNPKFSDVISLEGLADTKNPSLPIIAIPTTAGTAAEVTINYVISDTKNKRKFVCVDPNSIPVVSIVDPDLMSTMPKSLTAATGMDALTHAIEGYLTLGAWEMSDMFHLKAIELIAKYLRGAVDNTPEGREKMALAQYISGMGFSNAGLGIDHAMAHTLSAYYGIPHGVACAMLLPITMEFNKDASGSKYKDIAEAFGVDTSKMNSKQYKKAAIDAVKKLSKDIGIPTKCSQIKKDDIPNLASDSLKDACYPGNPRVASYEEIYEMFLELA